MAKQQPKRPNQHFPNEELLFCRVRRTSFDKKGRASPLAFELPDMSVNREQLSTAEETRKGHYPEDWGVVSFPVSAIPPREAWKHVSQVYQLKPRHVLVEGNFAHCEVRVWIEKESVFVLITARAEGGFAEDDPDRTEPRCPVEDLDPSFHLRWRKHIALVCKTELPPKDSEAA